MSYIIANDNIAVRHGPSGGLCACSISEAEIFEYNEANHYIRNLPIELRGLGLCTVPTQDTCNHSFQVDKISDVATSNSELADIGDDSLFLLNGKESAEETLLSMVYTERSLATYSISMSNKQRELEEEIEDIMHYLRDPEVKLNIVQAGKLCYILQDKLRTRFRCKQNKIASETFTVMHALKPKEAALEIKSVYNSKYKYKRLFKEKIDKAIGVKRKTN